MDNTEEAVQEAFNVLQLFAGVAVGAGVSLLVGILAWLALRVISSRTNSFRMLMRRIKIPFFALFLMAGAWVGLNYMNQVLTTDAVTWIPPLQHTLLIVTIVMVGWLAYAGAFIIEDAADRRQGETGSRRLATQAQMLRRLVQLAVVILSSVAVVLTFPSARVAMGSILASAGVISLVAGIAAQDSLSNTFAGLQITFTDALRVGDVVNVDHQFGTVEEITLTYVVLRSWDDRRFIVPSTQFTQTTFENWTRLHTKLSGTIELHLDWRAPVGMIRNEVDRLLMETDLWDHRSSSVQVTDSSDAWMLVRVVVTAKTSGDLWDLRCYMREHLIEWVVTNAPYAIARNRYQQEEIVEVNYDRSEQEIVALADELREIEDTAGGAHHDHEDTEEKPPTSKEEARLRAAKKRAKKVRRKRMRDRFADQPVKIDPGDSTRVLSPDEVLAFQVPTSPATPSEKEDDKVDTKVDSKTTSQVSDRMFSGSEEAERRSRLLEGPGEEAQRLRNEAQTLRALRLGEISEDVAIERLGGDDDARARVQEELDRIEDGRKKE
ncbi:MAG: mechanosensitive ion channel [Acidobacteriota bacterium]|nr:mechanosensitive ion channel [Acidobacteriota bacterium]